MILYRRVTICFPGRGLCLTPGLIPMETVGHQGVEPLGWLLQKGGQVVYIIESVKNQRHSVELFVCVLLLLASSFLLPLFLFGSFDWVSVASLFYIRV